MLHQSQASSLQELEAPPQLPHRGTGELGRGSCRLTGCSSHTCEVLGSVSAASSISVSAAITWMSPIAVAKLRPRPHRSCRHAKVAECCAMAACTAHQPRRYILSHLECKARSVVGVPR